MKKAKPALPTGVSRVSSRQLAATRGGSGSNTVFVPQRGGETGTLLTSEATETP